MRTIVAGFLLCAASWAQALTGHWKGSIQTPAGALEILLEFTSPTAGNISIPRQGARNLPLAGVGYANGEVTWAIPGIPGDPAFTGKLNGAKVEGTFTQGGAKLPCSFERSADPVVSAKSALDGIDAVIEEGLKKLEAPGMAVAVVKGREVIYAKGFGFRDAERKQPVDADTLFAIGSSTKAFTTFVLGTLVDEGKLEWDKPVRTWIPWFKLHDSSVTERLSVRDTVTHRSGLPRHDLLWYNNESATRESLVRRLPYLELSADLRERWQYNNLMYVTAGYLTEVMTGGTWEQAVRARILDPLGMKRTNFSVHESQKDANHAQPFEKREGKVTVIPFRPISLIGPAGSINSSVNEMARWVSVHLNGGEYQGRRLAEKATVADMHKPHMVMPATNPSPEITGSAYGMGWFTDSYRGHPRAEHGGNIDGFTAAVVLFPKDDLGIVALANMNGTALPSLTANTIADRLFGVKDKDWINEAAARRAAAEKERKEAEAKKESVRMAGTTPSHKLDDYAGAYEHPGYGTLTVALKNGALEMSFNRIDAPLGHWHYDTFNAGKGRDPRFADQKLTFATNEDGFIQSAAIAFEPSVAPIVFTKQPDARYADPAFLSRLEGEYAMTGQTISVKLKGRSLVAQATGQAPWDLLPTLAGTFQLKQVRVVSLRFVLAGDGPATAVEVRQPGAVLTAKRK